MIDSHVRGGAGPDGEATSATVAEIGGLAISIAGCEIVSRVDLAVAAGESVGLVGESGSGKSVTCRSLIGMLGFIGASITSGQVLIAGRDMTSASQRQWRQLRGTTVSLVPQASLAGLDPLIRVGAQLSEVIRRFDRRADTAARSLELLDQVQMRRPGEVLRAFPHELSGGMRQRAMIALAVAGRPKLLIADEATTALDATVQRSVLQLLTRLRAELGMALLLVSHDLGVVRTATDRVAVMYAGTVVEQAASTRIFHRPRHPYTAGLTAADPALVPPGKRLRSLLGDPPQPGAWAAGCRFAPRCGYRQEVCDESLPPLVVAADGDAVACVRAAEISL
jgi:oligopeptide/dipeptide ABC transporter ATP-binding protein